MKKVILTTQTPKGTRDFLPEEMVKRNFVVNKIKKAFEKYGFDPLETPAIEYLEVLTGKYGEDGEKLIYKFQDMGGRSIALRYDLTVPLCRVVAANPQLPLPFKRYQLEKVWRYDKPGKGRYREFWQCDVDIVGSSKIISDAEIVSLIVEVLKGLKFNDFVVKINNRKLLNGLLQSFEIEKEKANAVLRAIDKIGKKSVEEIKEELSQAGLTFGTIEKLVELMLEDLGTEQALDKIKPLAEKSEEGKEGFEEVKELFSYLKQAQNDAYCKFDLKLVRGLDYYTGSIFEAVVESPQGGSIAGGGRYDDLIGLFTGKNVPAIGVSFGLERIIEVMKQDKKFELPEQKTSTQVFIISFENDSKKVVDISRKFRNSGIKTQYDLMERPIKKQLKFCSQLGIPFALLIDLKELNANQVKIRDLATGNETVTTLLESIIKIKDGLI